MSFEAWVLYLTFMIVTTPREPASRKSRLWWVVGCCLAVRSLIPP